MNRDLAQMVVNSAARAASELANLMPLLKEHADAEKGEPIKLAVASAVYEAGLVQAEVFKVFPDLKDATEARLKSFGRSYF